MELIYEPQFLDDIRYWKKAGNKIIQNKITQLLHSIKENPYEGIGKPEALKYELTGKWSRRINKEHRIIYEVIDENIYLLSCFGHY
jgi:toxin YoeB